LTTIRRFRPAIFQTRLKPDFQEDDGSWTPDDYQQSAQNLFGDHEYFGDTMTQQRIDQGYQPFTDPGFMQGFEQVAPGSSQTIQLFEGPHGLVAYGFLTMAMMEFLRMRYMGIDFSNVDVSVPQRGEPVEPKPLPPAFDSVQPADAVDLRKFCTPIGDQGQTLRCSAFAWTHATEMVTNIKTGSAPRLSPTYTMLEFQRLQGDAKDYRYAYSGGDGTASGTETRRGTGGTRHLPPGICGRIRAKRPSLRSACWPQTRTGITWTLRRIPLPSTTFARC